MVLGPSRWIEDDPRFVSVLREEMTPLEIRQRVAEAIRAIVPVVVMEDEPPEDAAVWMRKLLRLVEEHRVRTFLIVAPLGARHHGIGVELGHLLTRLVDPHHAQPLAADDVTVLAEAQMTRVGTTLGWAEPGNRTHYYNDLLAMGCVLMRWESYEALVSNALAVAVEHANRHAAGRTPFGPAEVVALFEREDVSATPGATGAP